MGKVLRVEEGYDYGPADESSGIDSRSWRKKTARLFRENGYTIRYGGAFNTANPYELGFYSDNPKQPREEKTCGLARAAGAQMPRSFDLYDILNHPGAVIAKATFKDGGFSKYLLETEEQKVEFMAFAVLLNNDFANLSLNKGSKEAKALIDPILKGQIPDSKELEMWGWIFEEYMDTPSPYYTSYRIVADGYGIVHYAQLNRSIEKKGRKKVEDSVGSVPIFEGSKWGQGLENLLTHPRSPIYLNSKSVVSNILQGGKRILLDGRKIDLPTDRELLEQHNINSDHALASKELIDKAAKIAVLNRGTYPFSGVDFIQDQEGRFFFLEANSGPILNPQGLGLNKNAPQEECHWTITERIAGCFAP